MTTSFSHPPTATGAPGVDDRHLLSTYLLTGSYDGRWLTGRTDSSTASAPSAGRAVLPGGPVRAGESPTTALARATAEQLGTPLAPTRLVAVAWATDASQRRGETALIFAGPLVFLGPLVSPDLLPPPPADAEQSTPAWQLSNPAQALADLPTAIAEALRYAEIAPPIGYGGDRPGSPHEGGIQPAYARGSIIDTPSPCCTGHTARLTARDLHSDDATTGVRRRCAGCRRPYLLHLVGSRHSPQGIRWEPR